MTKKREIIGGEYVTIGAKTKYVPVYRQEELDMNLIEEKVIVPVKEKKEESNLVNGARYIAEGKVVNVLIDKNTGDIIMNPGTPLFYWIVGILWDKRFLRRGRNNITYLLILLNATSNRFSQSTFHIVRLTFGYATYLSYIQAAKWYSNTDDWILFYCFVALTIWIQWFGMKSDISRERDLIDHYNNRGLQSAIDLALL